MTSEPSAFGLELRRWRRARRHSQLALSVAADVSQRHLSHLETGRSRPSRAMVLRLAEALDVPLRERNELLGAAGFAPGFPRRSLDDADLGGVRALLGAVLDAHDPAPAYVVDRGWDLVLGNAATTRLTGLLPDPGAAAAAARGNVLRLLLHPASLRPHVVNLGEVAAVLVGRLRREVAAHGGSAPLAALLGEVEALVADVASTTTAPRDPVVPLHLDLGGRPWRFVTMISTIGAAHDVTLEELRLETLLPMDAPTRAALDEMAD